MNITPLNTAKAAAGIVIMAVVLIVVIGWYGDYKIGQAQLKQKNAANQTAETGQEDSNTSTDESAQQSNPGDEQPADESADAGDNPSDTGKTVIVLAEGLSLREAAQRNAKVIKRLKKGDELSLISEKSGWYEVDAGGGVKGWVTAGSQYSAIQQ